MAVPKHQIVLVDWGANQLGTNPEDGALNAESLAATGSGVWASVDTHATIRLGAFAFLADIEHTFKAFATVTVWGAVNSLQFRLRDTTSSLTLATVTFTGVNSNFRQNFQVKETTTFLNLPGAIDAIIAFEYTLISPTVAGFLAGTWFAKAT